MLGRSIPASLALAGLALVASAGGPAPRAAEVDLAPSAREIRPLLPGAEVPDVTLRRPDGSPAGLAELAASGPTVLVFYRGGW